MASKREIADDLLRTAQGKQWLSKVDLMRITKMGKTQVNRITQDLDYFGKNTSKKYYYLDIAESLATALTKGVMRRD